jgi:hypothetical protein
MSYSTFTMWGMLTLLALGAFGGAIYRGDLISTFRGAYPSDLARQSALRRCSQADAAFSKFSESDREACYRSQILHPPT